MLNPSTLLKIRAELHIAQKQQVDLCERWLAKRVPNSTTIAPQPDLIAEFDAARREVARLELMASRPQGINVLLFRASEAHVGRR